MPDDVPNESSRRSSWTWWLLWACFILFIVYPLSIGPVILILERSGVDSDFIEAIYAPLILLVATFEPVEDIFMWYLLGVWGL